MDTTSQLLITCEAGELDTVKIIIEGMDADVNATAAYRFESAGKTITMEEAPPLFVAAGNCNLEIAKYLIDKGANVNSRTRSSCLNYVGMSPLHAAFSLRPDNNGPLKRAMIEMLISSGADVTALTDNGLTIWMHRRSPKSSRLLPSHSFERSGCWIPCL